jgi:galacturonosyltransferase
LEKLGCQIIETKVNSRGTNPFQDIRLVFNYLYILKSYKPDLVLSYTVKSNVYGGMACRIKRVSQIANITGLGDAIENPGLLQKLVLELSKFAFKSTKMVFFQNESNKEFYEKVGIVNPKKTNLIPGSGVNLLKNSFESYPYETDRMIKFLFIGRLLKDKGLEEYLQASTYLKQKGYPIQCDLVGAFEGDFYKDSVKQYEENGIGKYLGESSHIHQLITQYHAVVLPSYHEGMANVLLEAAACGRPILASKIPGCQETFEEGISGLGFEPKSVDSLQDAILKFLSLTTEQRQKMGLAGRKKVEKEFDRQIVVDAYMKQIEKYTNKIDA